MKSALFYLFTACVFLLSCNKSVGDSTSESVSIAKLTGTYKGSTLTWEKVASGTFTNGSDPNATYTVNYANDRVTVTVTTSSPISKKSFDLPLKNKSEQTSGGQIITGLYEFIDTSYTTSLQKSYTFTGSIVKFPSGLEITGILTYLNITNPTSIATRESFLIPSSKKQ